MHARCPRKVFAHKKKQVSEETLVLVLKVEVVLAEQEDVVVALWW